MKFKNVLTLVAAGWLASSAYAADVGDFTTWTRNGSTTLDASTTVLQLTTLSDGSIPFGAAGSAWAPTKVSFAHDFSLSFNFTIEGGSGADGFALVFQKAAAGTAALGAAGGDLGYSGVGNSFGFVFDTWDNGLGFSQSDSAGHNVGWVEGGVMSPVSGGTSAADLSFLGASGLRGASPRFAQVNYEANLGGGGYGQLSLYLSADGVSYQLVEARGTTNWAGTFGGSVEDVTFGFTAGTGAANDRHNISAVFLEQATPAVPEPESVALVLAGLTVAGVVLRRRVAVR